MAAWTDTDFTNINSGGDYVNWYQYGVNPSFDWDDSIAGEVNPQNNAEMVACRDADPCTTEDQYIEFSVSRVQDTQICVLRGPATPAYTAGYWCKLQAGGGQWYKATGYEGTGPSHGYTGAGTIRMEVTADVVTVYINGNLIDTKDFSASPITSDDALVGFGGGNAACIIDYAEGGDIVTDTVPDAPTNVLAWAGDTVALVTWNVPASDGGDPITDYVIQSAPGPGFSSWTTFTDGTSTALSTIVTGLTNGTAYKFRVAATNGIGNSAYSTESASTTPFATGAFTDDFGFNLDIRQWFDFTLANRGWFEKTWFEAAPAGGDATATPATLMMTLAMQAPTPSAGASVSPSVLQLVLDLLDPAAGAGASVSPALLAMVLAAQAPSLSAGSSPDPATLAMTLAMLAPTASAGATVAPSPILLVLDLLDPAASGGSSGTPATASFALTTQAPSPSAGSNVAPSTAQFTLDMLDPALSAGSAVDPATLAMSFDVLDPAASGGSSGTPSTMNFVLVAQAPSISAGSSPAPSTLATKCSWIPRWANGLRASTAIRGPRSLPPMPMLTTCLNFSPDADRTSPLRTASAKSSMRSRSRAIRGRTSTPSTNRASVELERSAVWSTARPSVSLMAAPLSWARNPSATPHSSKSCAKRSSVVSSTRCLA